MSTIEEYSRRAHKLAIYPKEKGVEYTALGLASEAGEVAGKIKKIIRDGADWTGEEREEVRKAMLYELGDVVWYVNELGLNLGFSLTEVLAANIVKLESRQRRGVIGGSGDNR